MALLASLVLLWIQGPGDGSAFLQAPPREVQRAYWDMLQTTEIWVTTFPEGPQGKPLVNLVFHASFPGRAKRDLHSGLPHWPKGEPARLKVRAQPLPLTLVPELSLRILIDGDTIDFSGPDGRCGHPPCRDAAFDYNSNTVEAEIDPSMVRSLTAARSVRGEALGLPFELGEADRSALAEFAERIHLTPGKR